MSQEKFEVVVRAGIGYSGDDVWLLRYFGLGPLPEPTVRLAAGMAHGILGAFAKAGELRGHEADSTARMRGELEATKVHLEDMRDLVKMFCRPVIRVEERQ